jgi:hypothetical protein
MIGMSFSIQSADFEERQLTNGNFFWLQDLVRHKSLAARSRMILLNSRFLVLAFVLFIRVTSTLSASSENLVLHGGQLFDSVKAELRLIAAVVIEGERIKAVVPAGQRVSIPRGARVIDTRGKFLIPGLIDAHVHLVHILNSAHLTGDEILPLYLANGVTTLRDVGDEIVAESLVAKHSRNHPDTSPRIFLGSPLVDADPPYHRLIGRAFKEPDEVPAFVADMLQWGVQTFKIYVGTQRPVGKRLIEEAHRHGKWVTGHLGKYRAQDAVEDGIDSLEHISSVFDFVLPEDRPVMPPLHERGRYSAEELADVRYKIQEVEANADMAHPRVQSLIDRLVQRKVAVDPTLVVFRNWMLLRDLPEVYEHADVAAMPQRLQRNWVESSRASPPTPESLPLRQKTFRKQQELTGRLFRSGVSLLVGTDAPVAFCPPGFAIHQELALLVESGVTPAAALQMATLNNARALQQDYSLGSIEAGKLADLVILDANPLGRIENSRKIQSVVRGGKVCDRQALLKLVPAE